MSNMVDLKKWMTENRVNEQFFQLDNSGPQLAEGHVLTYEEGVFVFGKDVARVKEPGTWFL